MDLRANSAWFNHLLNDYYPGRLASGRWNLDGFFLDVIGDAYTGWVSGATSSELEEMRHGMRWFVQELRAVVGGECILLNNNAWKWDNDAVDGILVENHTGSEIGDAYWQQALGRVTRRVRRRNSTINSTKAQARAWARVAGVDQAGYSPGGDYDIGSPVLSLGSVDATWWPSSAHHIHMWDSTTYYKH